MRTLTLDLDTLTQLINGRETLEHWLDMEAGTVLSPVSYTHLTLPTKA